MPSVKVVFHIDELEKWHLLLANIRNLLKVIDHGTSEVNVLVNAKAISVFDPNETSAHLENVLTIAKTGVRFLLCQNSLNGFGIEADSLPNVVEVVPVGVLSLIELQAAGCAYIKP